MILAIELVKDRAGRIPFPWEERRGLRIYRHALERGVLLRPLGTTIYFMPPYVIEPHEIDLLARVATEGVDLACA
jgi:adenosylmethionine-8-amino-7-oxononanoate aminotransferase